MHDQSLEALLQEARTKVQGISAREAHTVFKAGVKINLTETLYMDLKPRGLDVYLINPGFVRTPLTDRNEFKMPALISADEAALETVRGLERGEFEIHYPKRFTRVLRFLRVLPYFLYFPLVRKITGL